MISRCAGPRSSDQCLKNLIPELMVCGIYSDNCQRMCVEFIATVTRTAMPCHNYLKNKTVFGALTHRAAKVITIRFSSNPPFEDSDVVRALNFSSQHQTKNRTR